VYVTLAYHAFIDNAKRHRLSGGIQGGYTSKMIDDTYFQFYNQYIDFAYVPDRSSNENFKNYNYSFFDGQAGLFYTFVLNAKTEINYGTSLFQIHQPKESVLFNSNNTSNKLGTRSIYTLGLKYKLTDDLTLNPQAMYLRQSKAKDLNLGVLATYQIQKAYPIQAMGGIFCRTRDALIFMLGMRYKNLDIRYSYDMTTSSARQMRGALNTTNKPLGAHEFVLNIYGKLTRKNSREYTLPCGIF
jgi:type IX secretion system PorP/SprF family membrane protein